MRIVRLTTLLDFGGQERKYLSFTENKELLSNEYIFAAIGYGGHAERVIRERGFKVKVFNQNPRISNLKNIWILYKWFKFIKPDIVHTAAAEANFHGVIAAKLAGVKVIIAEEIGYPNHSSKARLVFRGIYKLTKRVICVSQAVADFLITINEINKQKAVVVYNPVSEFKNVDYRPSEEFNIVCVGRLEKVKNQYTLVKAFSKMQNKKAKLLLVGDGSDRRLLENLIQDMNLSERVKIIGFSNEPEVYLSKASLFVLPSLSEGFGIAVVEAMQIGVPCLCSRVGGIPEFVEDNKTGWLFDPTNEMELVNKLDNLIAMPSSELVEIGQCAKDFVQNRFTIEKYVASLEKLYTTLGSKKKVA